MLKATIIDGYIDEPTCLGVPPYISPYPRYLAGALGPNISYFTIDQIRNDSSIIEKLKNQDLIVVIAGNSVPGRYLSGFPASPNELIRFFSQVTKPIKVLTGPAAKHGFGMSGGKQTKDTSFVKNAFDIIAKGDGEVIIDDLLKNRLKIKDIDSTKCRKNSSQIRDFAINGAQIITQHPFYPNYLIAEIETYRGCARSIVGGCSFCSEPLKGAPDFRPIKDIVDEIKALYQNGGRHFRLGNQPCIFSYMAKDAGTEEFPRPNPEAIEKLFKAIRSVAPELKTLHIDNANPGIISRYPKEAKTIANSIVKYHTSGDVAAFGVESTDPIVIKNNNLKASSEEVFSAIKLINEVGSKKGANGMPELLPGLNFVFGLVGESKNTFKLNFEFLEKILNSNLLVRRINLRQIIPIPDTKMYKIGSKLVAKHKADFKKFKRKVEIEIERPMLEKLLPVETELKNVYTEKHKGKLTFGRQIGSYPLLVGIPGVLELFKFIDVKVVDYGFRSITAVPYPIEINTVARETIEAIPGIGKKRAIRILANRPFKDVTELQNCLDESQIVSNITKFVKI
jgi:radical SAM superfamily enzyme with C-terminal helix-hairpin-helix motif